MTEQIQENTHNNKFNITDLLKLDHSYLKEGIKCHKDENQDKRTKLKHAKTFLDALSKHSVAEKKSVYGPCLKIKDLKMDILEGKVEHGIVDSKTKMLIKKLTGLRTLSDELEVELKVLAEIVEHHIKEEEDDLFPKLKKDLDKTILNEMGFQFMKLRNFTKKDLQDYPKLQEEVSSIDKLATRLPNNFVSKVKKHTTPSANR